MRSAGAHGTHHGWLAVHAAEPGALPSVRSKLCARSFSGTQNVVHAAPQRGRLLRLRLPLSLRALRRLGTRPQQDGPGAQRPIERAPSILPPAPEGPKTRFGFFGQYIDVKGVHIILRAVQILRSRNFTDFRIELNGDNIHLATPAIRQEIESFLTEEEQRAPSQRNVFNNGSYHVDQIGERMLRVDWSLVPSIWWEMFGNVISEAWMFKRPVICSNVGGMAERIEHDGNGLHFQVGDARSLAAAIRRACTEPGLWERLSEATPEPPSREECVKGYRALYEEA